MEGRLYQRCGALSAQVTIDGKLLVTTVSQDSRCTFSKRTVMGL